MDEILIRNHTMLFKYTFYTYLLWAILLMILCLLGLNKSESFFLYKILVVPIFLFLALHFLSTKNKWKNITTNILSIIIFFVASMLLFFVSGVYYLEHKVPQFLYKIEMFYLKKYSSEEKFSHFPKEIPRTAKNYYFQVEHSWSENVDLLYFDIDENYINTLKDKYAGKCKAYGKRDDIYKKYYYPHIRLSSDVEVCLFNPPNGEEEFLSGFAIGKRRVYFFHENW